MLANQNQSPNVAPKKSNFFFQNLTFFPEKKREYCNKIFLVWDEIYIFHILMKFHTQKEKH